MTTRETIADYLDALASSAPTPGGGSVAGLVSALGCALAEMVCALTSAAAEHSEIHAAAKQLTLLREDSLQGMKRDEEAYAGYIAATRLPKGTPEEKATRRVSMQAALIAAAEAPLALARTSLAALDLMPQIAAQGNKHVLSDARIGAMLAEVAIRAALVNVHVNTALIKDVEIAVHLDNEAAAIEAQARTRLADIDATLEMRTAHPA